MNDSNGMGIRAERIPLVNGCHQSQVNRNAAPLVSCWWTGKMTSSSSNHEPILTIPGHFPEILSNNLSEGAQLLFQVKEQICWGTQTTWMNKNLTCGAKNKQETLFPISEKKKSLRKKSMFQRLQGTNRRVKPTGSLLELSHAKEILGHHCY